MNAKTKRKHTRLFKMIPKILVKTQIVNIQPDFCKPDTCFQKVVVATRFLFRLLFWFRLNLAQFKFGTVKFNCAKLKPLFA